MRNSSQYRKRRHTAAFRVRQCNRLLAPVQGRQRLTGDPIDLQRPLQALAIVRLQSCGGFRIHLGEQAMHLRPAMLAGDGINFRPHLWVCRRQVGQALLQGLEIQHGATDQQRHSAGGMNIGNLAQRVFTKACRGIGFSRIEKAEQSVRRPGQHFRLRSGGADFQPLIDQRGIDIDDLQRQTLDQLDRRAGFTGAGRPHQKHHRLQCSHVSGPA